MKYREYLDQKDVFLSGIPMNYDSADVRYNFESGGMFEMNAITENNKKGMMIHLKFSGRLFWRFVST